MLENHQLIKDNFGAHLKALRLERNLSLRGLAIKSGLNHSKIADIENGKTDLQLTSIFSLAYGLELEAKELLNFETESSRFDW